MSYNGTLTIPAGTSQAAPAESILVLNLGIITRVRILAPSGTAGKVGFQIWHKERPIYPRNREGYFTGDGNPIVLDSEYILNEKPYSVRFVGWSPQASYDHTIYVEISMRDLPVILTQVSITELPKGF